MATLRLAHRMVPTQPTVVRDGVVVTRGYVEDGDSLDARLAECMTAVAAGEAAGGVGPVRTWGVDYPVTGTAYVWDYEVCDVPVVRTRDRAGAEEWAAALGGKVRPYGVRRDVGCPGDGMVVRTTEYEVMAAAAAKAVYDRVIRETERETAGPDRRTKRLALCRAALATHR